MYRSEIETFCFIVPPEKSYIFCARFRRSYFTRVPFRGATLNYIAEVSALIYTQNRSTELRFEVLDMFIIPVGYINLI